MLPLYKLSGAGTSSFRSASLSFLETKRRQAYENAFDVDIYFILSLVVRRTVMEYFPRKQSHGTVLERESTALTPPAAFIFFLVSFEQTIVRTAVSCLVFVLALSEI